MQKLQMAKNAKYDTMCRPGVFVLKNYNEKYRHKSINYEALY